MDAQCESSEAPPGDPQSAGKIRKAFKLFGKGKPASSVASIFGKRGKGEGAQKSPLPLPRSKTLDGLSDTTVGNMATQDGAATEATTRSEPAASTPQHRPLSEGACEQDEPAQNEHPCADGMKDYSPTRPSISSITSAKSLNFLSLLRRSRRGGGCMGGGGGGAGGGGGEGAGGDRQVHTEAHRGGRQRKGLRSLFGSMRWRRRDDEDGADETDEGGAGPPLTASRSNSVEIIKEHLTLTPRPAPKAEGERSLLDDSTVAPDATSKPGTPKPEDKTAGMVNGGTSQPNPNGNAGDPTSDRLSTLLGDISSILSFDSLTGCGDIVADVEAEWAKASSRVGASTAKEQSIAAADDTDSGEKSLSASSATPSAKLSPAAVPAAPAAAAPAPTTPTPVLATTPKPVVIPSPTPVITPRPVVAATPPPPAAVAPASAPVVKSASPSPAYQPAPAPVSPAPVAFSYKPAPVSPAPVASSYQPAPVSPAPVAFSYKPAPVSPAPVVSSYHPAPAPISPAPVSPAPVAFSYKPAPVSPAPVASSYHPAPVSPAPLASTYPPPPASPARRISGSAIPTPLPPSPALSHSPVPASPASVRHEHSGIPVPIHPVSVPTPSPSPPTTSGQSTPRPTPKPTPPAPAPVPKPKVISGIIKPAPEPGKRPAKIVTTFGLSCDKTRTSPPTRQSSKEESKPPTPTAKSAPISTFSDVPPPTAAAVPVVAAAAPPAEPAWAAKGLPPVPCAAYKPPPSYNTPSFSKPSSLPEPPAAATVAVASTRVPFATSPVSPPPPPPPAVGTSRPSSTSTSSPPEEEARVDGGEDLASREALVAGAGGAAGVGGVQRSIPVARSPAVKPTSLSKIPVCGGGRAPAAVGMAAARSTLQQQQQQQQQQQAPSREPHSNGDAHAANANATPIASTGPSTPLGSEEDMLNPLSRDTGSRDTLSAYAGEEQSSPTNTSPPTSPPGEYGDEDDRANTPSPPPGGASAAASRRPSKTGSLSGIPLSRGSGIPIKRDTHAAPAYHSTQAKGDAPRSKIPLSKVPVRRGGHTAVKK